MNWHKKTLISGLAAALSLSPACKRQEDLQWSEADLESIQSTDRQETPPPLEIVANIRRVERNSALKIFDD